jgi:hypothetical protein
VPDETLPARGISAEFFSQFCGIGTLRKMPPALLPPRKNLMLPQALFCPVAMPPVCRWLVATLPQGALIGAHDS